MPYRGYFHDFVTKLLLRSNSLRNHESSPFSGQVLGPTQTTGAGPLGHLTARGGKSGVWASGKVLILRHFGLVLVLIDQKEGPHPRIHADARFAR